MKAATLIAAAAVLAFLSTAAPVQAQDESKGYVIGDFVFQPAPAGFSETVTHIINLEPSKITTTYPVKAAPGFDIGAGVKVWESLAAGVIYSRFTQTNTADISGNVPHPFFYNQSRTLTGQATDLSREESAVHIHAMYLVPAGDKLVIGIFGGPTWFQVKQDFVAQANYTETYPYTTVAFKSADVTNVSATKLGFNAGVDAMYFFTTSVGVGGNVRFSKATIDFTSPGGNTVSVEAGGVQVGGGLRLRF